MYRLHSFLIPISQRLPQPDLAQQQKYLRHRICKEKRWEAIIDKVFVSRATGAIRRFFLQMMAPVAWRECPMKSHNSFRDVPIVPGHVSQKRTISTSLSWYVVSVSWRKFPYIRSPQPLIGVVETLVECWVDSSVRTWTRQVKRLPMDPSGVLEPRVTRPPSWFWSSLRFCIL